MSFSDFKKSPNKGGGRSNVAPSVASKKRMATPLVSGQGQPPSTGGGSNLVNLISQSLLQYQQNVGILEKIVQALTAPRRNTASDELDVQFKAQVDVIGQLEEKLLRQLQQGKQQTTGMGQGEAQSSSSSASLMIKLSRDFERVQHRAVQLQEQVTKYHKQQAANAKAQVLAGNSSSSAAQYDPGMMLAGGSGDDSNRGSAQEEYYQKMQAQLEEDRLNEEIMREREEEIRNINRGMHQVNEIYKDLAHIVGSQQEQIDNIETQMEDSRANAESGLQQVEKANDKFNSSQCTIS